MADSPMKDHPLGLAARYNDAAAEEHGFQSAIERMGLTIDDAMYLAEQRAIRVCALMFGWPGIIGSTTAVRVPRMSPMQRKMFTYIQSAVLDGVVIGWKGREISDGA